MLPVRLLLAATCAVALSPAAPRLAAAQDFFVPGQPSGQGRSAQQSRPAAPRRERAPAPVQVAPPITASPTAPAAGVGQVQGGDDLGPSAVSAAQMQLPPPPELPALPKGATPPAAVIGVMGVPEVMRASSAAQQVEKLIGERREKLNEDAQKEQAAWRDLQQSLVNERGKLSPDQVRTRERELQERITSSQRQFRDRNRIIQEAAQYALAQIERTLVAVIRQVADSRGMNLVLHRQQVALNVNEFDITQQVADQLNKVMSTVVVPPDGVEPPMLSDKGQDKTNASPASAPGKSGN